MSMFSKITRFLPALEAKEDGTDAPGDGSQTGIAREFFEELSDFMIMHPSLSDFDHFEYLDERGINVNTSDRKYLSRLDLKATLALLFGLVRNERVVPGTLAAAFKNGRIRAYLRRLSELDQGCEGARAKA